MVSSVLMNVVKGAVNTVIVCWADNQGRIMAEHANMGEELLAAWAKSFPGSVSVDLGQQHQLAIPSADPVTRTGGRLP